MRKISAIICAYNEEKTVKEVVTTVYDYFYDEVIVVNDGSTDGTDKILTELLNLSTLKYIALPENKGKGYAMATGVENSTGEIIVFIDADLSNLKEEHFEQLLTPIFNNECDMVLGQATETLINYKFNPFKSFTGERAMLKKDIMPILEEMKTSKFGVETLINLYFQAHEKSVKYTMLEGLKHPTKFDKANGKSQAIKEFVLEGHQIALAAFNSFNLLTKIVRNQIKKKYRL
ncbi:Undecaprenyl-phosphate 4-deoxy-4-formamido-L-arabinose transferase [bioreactor metagenome]|jgi:glycosyltransferase involved in cell wall biosynthesis|uniref:Undecaprenyl-phosphate 4-deoxy-4-formamido-L-arabinose transferase n=1 Tax=bioreactor metagenome TaxID=1076179 RepID=A0A644W4R6_9ZZZZ|nr:glycosyltransferase family 2 protein [Bacteroidales bacterium]